MRKIYIVVFLCFLFFNTSKAETSLPECQDSPIYNKARILDFFTAYKIFTKWKNCEGTLINGDGSSYVGQFKNGKKNGFGTYEYVYYWNLEKKIGDIYTGQFKDGKKHGKGTYKWVGGKEYIGEYKNNKISGQGTMTFPNGTKYVGQFENDLFHGLGKMIYTDGRIDKGVWKKGKLAKPIK